MSSIVTNILCSTLGLLWNKVGDSTTENLQQDSDVTDAKTREFLVRELHNIKTKFDDLSCIDLLSSYTFLQEGVDVLNVTLNESNLEQKASTVGSDNLNELLQLSHAVREIKLNSDKEFESAKKRFENARNKAADALSADTLSVEDQILATKLRVVSEILECLDNPENAIAGCLSVLKKLHSLPAIQEIFHVYILHKKLESLDKKCVENVKSVMLINFVLFEYVLKFSSKHPVGWPTIELDDRSLNPILDWMLISERNCMEKHLDQQPGRFFIGVEIQPYNVAMNSRGEIIVIDYDTIKIISRTGEEKTVELRQLPHPKEFENVIRHWNEVLTVDMNDKVYLMRGLEKQTGLDHVKSYALYVFNEDYSVIHTCPLDFLKVLDEDDTFNKMTINQNNDIIISQEDDPNLYICDNVGQLKHKIDMKNVEGRPIFCISGKNEIVISRDCEHEVEIYSEEGNLKLMINVPEEHSVLSVAFHHVMCKVIVLTRDYDDLHHLCIYSESGELENTALIRDDFGWSPAVTSHPSGPFAVVTSYHLRMVKLRNEYLEQAGRAQRVKYLRNLIHGQVTHSVEDESESSDDDVVGSYVPAGLAAMLSGVARATIKQTIPGVTVRSRADYKNLKVAVSLESLTDGFVKHRTGRLQPDNASTAASNTDMNEIELPSTSFPKHLEFQGGLSQRQEQIADKVPQLRLTTPSPESCEDEVDISQDALHKENKTMMQRLRDKFKEMGHGSHGEEN